MLFIYRKYSADGAEQGRGAHQSRIVKASNAESGVELEPVLSVVSGERKDSIRFSPLHGWVVCPSREILFSGSTW